MNTALKQLSWIAGMTLALFVLVLAFMRGTPIGEACFRAVVVMCIGSVIVAVFFRFFTSVLRGFFQEKVDEQKQSVAKRHEAAARKGNPSRPG